MRFQVQIMTNRHTLLELVVFLTPYMQMWE